MNIEDLREYCIAKKGASESFPFHDTTLVFKVMDKMFAYFSIAPKDGEFFVNLKCDPERSILLREEYEGICKGFHTDGKMWNSVYLESDVPDNLIKELVDHSLEEVILKLSKKKQNEYFNS